MRDRSLTEESRGRRGGPVPVQLSMVRPGAPQPTAAAPHLSWGDFARQQPEFADQVRLRFRQHDRHVLATMALADSARVSGTDVHWRGDDLLITADPAAPKAQDLSGDARFALHVNPGDGSRQQGDIRIVGIVEPVLSGPHFDEFTARPTGGRSVVLFRLLLQGIEVTTAASDGLSVTTWLPQTELNTVILP